MRKVILFLIVISFSAMATMTEKTVESISLIELKKDSVQYISICKAAGRDCKPGTTIWVERDFSNDNFYLMPSKLKLIKARKDNDGYTKINTWDFSMENGGENNTRGKLKKRRLSQ